MTIVPQAAGLNVVFVLPEGVTPARSNFPGVVSARRWRATYAAIPSQGVTWEAAFKSGIESQLPGALALVISSRFPGGGGWQSLPSWLPQEHVVWRQDVIWALPAPPPIPPVPSLSK